MCNDIVLLRPTVDVTDANVLQVFQSLYAGGMLVYILLSHLFVSVFFLSNLPSCFQRYFYKMEIIRC